MLVVFSMFMHLTDDQRDDSKHHIKGHGGFVDWLYRANNRPPLSEDTRVVGPMLTVQSIRSALMVGILAALIKERPGSPATIALPLRWKTIVDSPSLFLLCAVCAALGIAIILTSVTLLCYDYSVRFAWDAATKSQYQKALLLKAHHLGVLSFYLMMLSLGAIPALFNPFLGLFSALMVFVAMWWYYYAPTDLEGTQPTTR